MKGKLEFDLPEEDEEFNMAIKGALYRYVLQDVDNFMRDRIKYGNLPDKDADIYEEVRKHIYDCLEHRNLPLFD